MLPHWIPIIRRSNCVPLSIFVCPVVAVVMLESRVARCVHCVENVASLDTHHQEIQLRSTLYICLSCCSCCDAGESGGKLCGTVWRMLPDWMPIIRRSNCVPVPIFVCPVVAVVMLESRVARCVQCVENFA